MIETFILSEDQAKEICSWKYEGEYAVYNFSDWKEVVKNGWDLSVKEIRDTEYLAIFFDDVFIAYGRIFIVEGNVFLGIGVKPAVCGNGLGAELMMKLIEVAEERYPRKQIMVEVRDFNKRAKRCYESIGFEVIDEYWKDTLSGGDNFYLMEYMREGNAKTST